MKSLVGTMMDAMEKYHRKYPMDERLRGHVHDSYVYPEDVRVMIRALRRWDREKKKARLGL